MRTCLDGFDSLKLEQDEEGIRFNELSDGQRSLIFLYAILHFLLARGNTVILDEPDNFISLREIQPWLMAVDNALEHSAGQILNGRSNRVELRSLGLNGRARFWIGRSNPRGRGNPLEDLASLQSVRRGL